MEKNMEGSSPTGSTDYLPLKTEGVVTGAPASAPRLSARHGDATALNKMKQLHTVEMSYTGNRWYCYYYEVQANKPVPVRVREYGFVNKEHDPKKRMELLLKLRDKLQGEMALNKPQQNTLIFYLNKVLADGKHYKESSRKNFKVHINLYCKYLVKHSCGLLQPHEINEGHIHSYLTWLLSSRENRTVNNYIASISTAMDVIQRKYRVKFENPCKHFKKLHTVSRMHQAYTEVQATRLSKYLAAHDPELLTYIRFISYTFLRTVEVRKLKVGDIDFTRMIIKMQTGNVKTNESRNKKILQLFHLQVMQYKQYPENYFVFGRCSSPGIKPVGEKYFSKKFQLVKKVFGLSRYHTLYGFRHTVVSQLLRNGADKFDVMKYTGHTTLSAFEKYIQSIFAEPPKDLSDKITVAI